MPRIVVLTVAASLGFVFRTELWDSIDSLLALGAWDERYAWALVLPVTYLLGMLLLRDGR